MNDDLDSPVIVGVALTERGRGALLWARDLARELGKPLLAVRAWEPPQWLLEGEDFRSRSRLHVAVLGGAREWVDETLGPNDAKVEAIMGPPGPVLAALSESASAVVLGGGPKPVPHDARSTTWYCLHYCKAPVLVTPDPVTLVLKQEPGGASATEAVALPTGAYSHSPRP